MCPGSLRGPRTGREGFWRMRESLSLVFYYRHLVVSRDTPFFESGLLSPGMINFYSAVNSHLLSVRFLLGTCFFFFLRGNFYVGKRIRDCVIFFDRSGVFIYEQNLFASGLSIKWFLFRTPILLRQIFGMWQATHEILDFIWICCGVNKRVKWIFIYCSFRFCASRTKSSLYYVLSDTQNCNCFII